MTTSLPNNYPPLDISTLGKYSAGATLGVLAWDKVNPFSGIGRLNRETTLTINIAIKIFAIISIYCLLHISSTKFTELSLVVELSYYSTIAYLLICLSYMLTHLFHNFFNEIAINNDGDVDDISRELQEYWFSFMHRSFDHLEKYQANDQAIIGNPIASQLVTFRKGSSLNFYLKLIEWLCPGSTLHRTKKSFNDLFTTMTNDDAVMDRLLEHDDSFELLNKIANIPLISTSQDSSTPVASLDSFQNLYNKFSRVVKEKFSKRRLIKLIESVECPEIPLYTDIDKVEKFKIWRNDVTKRLKSDQVTAVALYYIRKEYDIAINQIYRWAYDYCPVEYQTKLLQINSSEPHIYKKNSYIRICFSYDNWVGNKEKESYLIKKIEEFLESQQNNNPSPVVFAKYEFSFSIFCTHMQKYRSFFINDVKNLMARRPDLFPHNTKLYQAAYKANGKQKQAINCLSHIEECHNSLITINEPITRTEVIFKSVTAEIKKIRDQWRNMSSIIPSILKNINTADQYQGNLLKRLQKNINHVGEYLFNNGNAYNGDLVIIFSSDTAFRVHKSVILERAPEFFGFLKMDKSTNDVRIPENFPNHLKDKIALNHFFNYLYTGEDPLFLNKKTRKSVVYNNIKDFFCVS